jgi:hypothetical protein
LDKTKKSGKSVDPGQTDRFGSRFPKRNPISEV